MNACLSSLVLVVAGVFVHPGAKDKKGSSLPVDILRATTVRVVVSPDAGEPVDHPMANANRRDSVEKAMMQWGRLQPVMDGQESDLVIAVRTGNERDQSTSARASRKAPTAVSTSAPSRASHLRSSIRAWATKWYAEWAPHRQ
jgi:hypothetical protein